MNCRCLLILMHRMLYSLEFRLSLLASILSFLYRGGLISMIFNFALLTRVNYSDHSTCVLDPRGRTIY